MSPNTVFDVRSQRLAVKRPDWESVRDELGLPSEASYEDIARRLLQRMRKPKIPERGIVVELARRAYVWRTYEIASASADPQVAYLNRNAGRKALRRLRYHVRKHAANELEGLQLHVAAVELANLAILITSGR